MFDIQMRQQILECSDQAFQQSPFLKAIQDEGVRRREVESKELRSLLAYIQKAKPAVNPQEVLEGLRQDENVFQHLRSVLHGREIDERNESIHQLQTNKMCEGSQKAQILFATSFPMILQGKLPQGYDLSPPTYNIPGDPRHIYASERGITLKHLLIRTALSLTGFQNTSIDHLHNALGIKDVKASSFVHYTPLPDTEDWSFLQSSPYYVERGTKKYIAILHNGYTFGGCRGEDETMASPFPPEDCASFIAKYLACQPVSTSHFIDYHHLLLGFESVFPGSTFSQSFKKWQEKAWEKNPYVQSLSGKIYPTPIEKVIPGDLQVERKYPDIRRHPEISITGCGGHCGFVIGEVYDQERPFIVTLGAAREIDDHKDFIYGLDLRPKHLNPLNDDRLVIYFSNQLPSVKKTSSPSP